MTTQDHPKFPDSKVKGRYDLTTYDHVLLSSSQQKYTFGKETRFPSVKKFGPPEVGYKLPTTKSTRAAGFGIGDRFKKNDKQRSPSPQNYNIPSLFKPNNTTSTFAVHTKTDKTFCFGNSRECFNKTVINRDNIGADPLNPGPATYKYLKPLGEEAVGFKLKYKIDYDDPAKRALKKGIPGVGTYEDVLQLDKVGRYTSSEFSNSKSARWTKDEKLKPIQYTYLKSPGPGNYETIGDVGNANVGHQNVSTYHSIKTRRFVKGEQRPRWHARFKTPGPGAYMPPSDFGYVSVSPRDKSGKRSNQSTMIQQIQASYGFPQTTRNKFSSTLQEKRKSANIVLSQIQSDAEEATPQKQLPHFSVQDPVHYTIDANREGIFDPSPEAKKGRSNGSYYIQTNPVVAPRQERGADRLPQRMENLQRPSGREVPPKTELPEAMQQELNYWKTTQDFPKQNHRSQITMDPQANSGAATTPFKGAQNPSTTMGGLTFEEAESKNEEEQLQEEANYARLNDALNRINNDTIAVQEEAREDDRQSNTGEFPDENVGGGAEQQDEHMLPEVVEEKKGEEEPEGSALDDATAEGLTQN